MQGRPLSEPKQAQWAMRFDAYATAAAVCVLSPERPAASIRREGAQGRPRRGDLLCPARHRAGPCRRVAPDVATAAASVPVPPNPPVEDVVLPPPRHRASPPPALHRVPPGPAEQAVVTADA